MTMLTFDWLAEDLIERYSGFTHALTWYQMYCAGSLGTNKMDYVKGFQYLRDAYDHLWDSDEDVLPDWKMESTLSLIESIQALIKEKRFSGEQIHEIALLIKIYQDKEEKSFRSAYIEGQVECERKRYYPEGIIEAVRDLLKNDKNDEAIITAFKFLDNHLQKLTGASPYEYYGEELINYAFSPKNGVLQLGTDLNEQIGLRNFFSGANAIFRNPSAHRFMKHGLFFAATVVAMVSAMTEIASNMPRNDSQMPAG